MPSKPSRDRLPFEPRKNKQKTPKTPPPLPAPMGSKKRAAAKEKSSLKAIPEVVTQRMVKRMALCSGVPTGLGMASFVVFYWVVSHNWLDIPNYAVGGVSFGFFGLGVLGLSYGIFSASWEPEQAGSWLGWSELKTNLGRTIGAWRSARQEAKKTKESQITD